MVVTSTYCSLLIANIHTYIQTHIFFHAYIYIHTNLAQVLSPENLEDALSSAAAGYLNAGPIELRTYIHTYIHILT